ncbi:hypothetical protein [Streptomyces sp. NPDC048825]|uniref:hypothetical protein n=1 Tax=Streptomyces sp. NPDC048825 TaxID=3365592 RepID=UPI00371F8A2C
MSDEREQVGRSRRAGLGARTIRARGPEGAPESLVQHQKTMPMPEEWEVALIHDPIDRIGPEKP